jgi:hypothetical protein
MKITKLLLATCLLIASSVFLYRCARKATPTLPSQSSAATVTPSSSTDSASVPYAAVALPGATGTTGSTGSLGALMLGSKLEFLAPVVNRDKDGKATEITGVVWRQDSKGQMVVYLDSTGLPTRTVLGEYILEFSNWSADKSSVDIAKIYTPTGYIEIFKGVKISGTRSILALQNFKLDSALNCFPACESDNENLAALLKLAALGLSLGGCGVATTVSLGAMALPCLGVLVTTIEVIGVDEDWLGDKEKIGNILLANDSFECAFGDAVACLSVALDMVAGNLESADSGVTNNSSLLDSANVFLKNPTATSGIVQAGTDPRPSCSGDYQCTPGSSSTYIPCLNGGFKTCGTTCQYSACPDYYPASSSSGSGSSTTGSSSSSGSGSSTTGSSSSGSDECICSDTGTTCTKNSDCPDDTSIPGVIIPGVCGCPVN